MKSSVKWVKMGIFGVILDVILKKITARFTDFKILKFISLAHKNKFQYQVCQVD